jgi:hypothetical protein
MLMVFDYIEEAQELCDKIHSYLQENCPGYQAIKWQDPVEIKGLFYVSLPKEFEKDMYPVKEKISVSLKSVTDKSPFIMFDEDFKKLQVSTTSQSDKSVHL